MSLIILMSATEFVSESLTDVWKCTENVCNCICDNLLSISYPRNEHTTSNCSEKYWLHLQVKTPFESTLCGQVG